MKKKRLTREELAIVEALLRDVAATVGVSDEAAYRSTLIAETLELLYKERRWREAPLVVALADDARLAKIGDEVLDVGCLDVGEGPGVPSPTRRLVCKSHRPSG